MEMITQEQYATHKVFWNKPTMDPRHIKVALDAARAGLKVLVYSSTMTDSSRVFCKATESLGGDESRVSRANGNEHVSYPSGGKVKFIGTVDRLRGSSFDQAYVPIGMDQDALFHVLLTLSGSDDGLVTGY